MSDAGPSEPTRVDPALRPLEGGKLLSQITNRIVSLTREHYGRGPIKTKTYVLDNLIVCVLSDGFTAIERTMMKGGEAERVLEMRRDFQRMMKNRYSEMIEELTGRKVLAFLGGRLQQRRPWLRGRLPRAPVAALFTEAWTAPARLQVLLLR